jgi:hypothetical protein
MTDPARRRFQLNESHAKVVLLTILLSPFLLCCCVPAFECSRDRIYESREHSIKRGMTIDQVKAIMGQPDEISEDGLRGVWKRTGVHFHVVFNDRGIVEATETRNWGSFLGN